MAAFVYSDGDNVPRDVTQVVVHPSVRILPPKAFRGHRKLREIRLHEGLEQIGDRAFYKCVSLRRLDCPSTVVRIGIRSFWRCERLEELRLNDGVEEIGDEAFCGCDSLRHLECPSAAVRIGVRAFGGCWELESIEIPSRAFVIQRETLGYACRLITNGTIPRTDTDSVLIAPGCLAILPESNLTELGKSIGIVVNDGEGTEEDRLVGVRREVRKEVRGEVSTILGLAFWRANIDRAERARASAANAHRSDTGGGRKRAEGDAVWTPEAREECRGAGKGREIAQNVLPFLDDLP